MTFLVERFDVDIGSYGVPLSFGMRQPGSIMSRNAIIMNVGTASAKRTVRKTAKKLFVSAFWGAGIAHDLQIQLSHRFPSRSEYSFLRSFTCNE